MWFIINSCFWIATVEYFESLSFCKLCVWFSGNRFKNGGLADKFPKMKTVKLQIGTGISRVCLFCVLWHHICKIEYFTCSCIYLWSNLLEKCCLAIILSPLQWRHNECDGVSITSLLIVYSTVYSGADQRKHQSSASVAFGRGIHRWPVNSPHKLPVTQKIFPFDDVIMR